MLFSRNVEVAEHVNREGFIYQPECLNEEQSWELLKLKAVPRGYHRGRYFTCIYYVSFIRYNFVNDSKLAITN